MRRAPFVAVLVGCLAGGALVACVDVPDSVRAQFAGPSTTDRSNYRPGRHGSAPPIEDPSLPAVAAASPASPEATPNAADASTTTTTTTAGVVPNEKATTTDGGTP